MAKYTGNSLTNLGKDLLARAVVSGEEITFTKVELGKGTLVGGIEDLIALSDSFKALSITSTTKLSEGGYRIRAAFDNSGITEDTPLKEIGVFARGEDSVEVLYSYCYTTSPDLIPAEGSGVIERVEDIITYISSATTINAVIDQSKIYATIKDLNEGLALKENSFSKNNAFNKNFGTTNGTVAAGSDSRIINAVPKTRTINNKALTGNIILSPSDIGAEPSFNKNNAFNKTFGSTSGTVAQGNDSRIVNAVPNSRKVNNKALTSNITLLPSDIGAEPSFSKNNAFNKNFGTTNGTVAAGNDSRTINAVPKNRTVNGKPLTSNIILSSSDVGAEPSFSKNSAFNKNFGTTNGTVAAGNDSRIINAVPNSRKVNNKALTSNITLLPSDVGAEPSFNKNNAFNKSFGTTSGTIAAGNDTRIVNAVPNSRTINGHRLSTNIALTAANVGALGTTGTAVNSNKLENKTKAQIISEARHGLPYNEKILWSGTSRDGGTYTLSESYSSFHNLIIEYRDNSNNYGYITIPTSRITSTSKKFIGDSGGSYVQWRFPSNRSFKHETSTYNVMTLVIGKDRK